MDDNIQVCRVTNPARVCGSVLDKYCMANVVITFIHI